MGWFRRRKEEPVPDDAWTTGPVRAPVPVPEPEPAPRGLTFLDDGDIHINIGTVEEAKLAIKQLKLKKKEYAVLKKGVTNELSQINATRKVALGKRGSMMRGGGNFGKTVRAFDRMGRDAERRNHAGNIAPLEGQKAAIESRVLRIDQAITMLEGYILEQESSA